MSRSGLILQPTYRIQNDKPVIHLYGVLEDGSPCLIREDRFAPRFYIRSQDAQKATTLGARNQLPTPRRSIEGEELVQINLAQPGHTPPLRNRLIAAGIDCFEADLPFALVFLMESGIKGGFRVAGKPKWEPPLGFVWENPELTPDRVAPTLKVLSIDIETDPTTTRLLSVALYGLGTAQVLLLRGNHQPAIPSALPCGNEQEILERLSRLIRELDPDVITGWNVIDFDIQVLHRIANRLGTPLKWGRDKGPIRLRSSRSPWSSWEVTIPGRQVLDGIDLLRSSFIRMEEYSLDFVSRSVLGEGKTLSSETDKGVEILRCYREEPERFVEYNLTDARLAAQILEKLGLVSLSVERSLLTGLPIHRVGASIASFDFLYLTELHKQNRIAHSVKRVNPLPAASNAGGHVLEPSPGLYSQVLVMDFKSLYPSIIRTFQIDPLGRLDEARPDAIAAPNGAYFQRGQGILPHLLDELFPRREAARQRGDQTASHAIKILMNSFYGVLGTSACRFYHPQLAGAITSFGKNLLLWSKSRLEEWGFVILYGDTDSLFILSGADEDTQAQKLGRELVLRLNRDLAKHVSETWSVRSHLELEFERVYQKLHFPAVRHGSSGARKRYAGLIQNAGQSQIRFVGMEVVRRDWTALAKQVQRELYHRLFHELPLDDYLPNLITKLRAGEIDDCLVYRKGLRKSLEAYTTTTPPHVVAARKLETPPTFGTVSYLMTQAGPEPLSMLQSPIDYDHYIQRQIRPVSVPILELLNLDFSEMIGESYQLRLFD